MDAQRNGLTRRSRGRPPSDELELIENQLLKGALKEFLRNGYGGTSITQIVKSLGISKTTLYSRYASKAELFHAIIADQFDGLSAHLALQSGAQLTLVEGLQAYAIRAMEISLKGNLLQVNRLLYSECYRFPALGVAAAERTELGIRRIADFIAECAVRDGIACRDPRGISEAFIFMLRGWYVNVMLSGETISKAAIKRFAEQAARAVVSSRAEW